MSSTEAQQRAAALWRIESPKLIAALVRLVRDVERAEELAQDTFVAALETWESEGVPLAEPSDHSTSNEDDSSVADPVLEAGSASDDTTTGSDGPSDESSSGETTLDMTSDETTETGNAASDDPAADGETAEC